jgi:uncharacterized coiled-coil protein SlyX
VNNLSPVSTEWGQIHQLIEKQQEKIQSQQKQIDELYELVTHQKMLIKKLHEDYKHLQSEVTNLKIEEQPLSTHTQTSQPAEKNTTSESLTRLGSFKR